MNAPESDSARQELDMHDRGNHPCLSEDWLLDNLPEGWTYDCHMGEQWGFTVTATDGKTLFIPLDLLALNRTPLREAWVVAR